MNAGVMTIIGPVEPPDDPDSSVWSFGIVRGPPDGPVRYDRIAVTSRPLAETTRCAVAVTLADVDPNELVNVYDEIGRAARAVIDAWPAKVSAFRTALLDGGGGEV